MPLALYIKKDSAQEKRKAKKRDRAISTFILALGVVAIATAAWPYFAWQFKTLPRLTSKVEQAPIPKEQVLSEKSTLEANVQVIKDPDGFSYFSTNYVPNTIRPKEFAISIPRLKIKNAKVKVDNLNFATNLSHFPGSALPGEAGNSFITGHSVLPQFNDPDDYRAIFTKLTDLEVGDDVYVQVENQNFHYTVQYSKVVDPHDLSVLSQISAQGRNLTLMTCVPPGTSTKRLVVITSLI